MNDDTNNISGANDCCLSDHTSRIVETSRFYWPWDLFKISSQCRSCIGFKLDPPPKYSKFSYQPSKRIRARNKTIATVRKVLVLKDIEVKLHPQRSTLIFTCGRTSTQQSVSSDSVGRIIATVNTSMWVKLVNFRRYGITKVIENDWKTTYVDHSSSWLEDIHLHSTCKRNLLAADN